MSQFLLNKFCVNREKRYMYLVSVWFNCNMLWKKSGDLEGSWVRRNRKNPGNLTLIKKQACIANIRLKIWIHSCECLTMDFPRTTREYVYWDEIRLCTLTNTDKTAHYCHNWHARFLVASRRVAVGPVSPTSVNANRRCLIQSSSFVYIPADAMIHKQMRHESIC